ncbi:MAG: LL-diaminopimelate aminotransferase [Clostridiaceae bacterium]|jgi:LL-diaminopimelate aminotransferase|nr:LL-diaminopimelate aminotransferase [Clostridiaceae bacterium]
MLKVNEHFLQLPGSYLFSEIARRVSAYRTDHPQADVISLGIGDVTRPLAPTVIRALHEAADDQADEATFRGYGPEQGYAFLREAIAGRHYLPRQVVLQPDEIFVSDGAKSDTGNIGDIFSPDAVVAVCDPVYPVYVDTSAMSGRAGTYGSDGRWSRLIYLPCSRETGFCPQLPGPQDPVPDLIYLCFPNNPTGAVIQADALREWVDYARNHGSVILYDAAYEAYITEDLPHSIYEIEGARSCAIEFCSFSKLAGFTGLRLGFTVIPHELKIGGVSLNKLWNRRQTTKFNGACYLAQKAGEAVYSEQGQREIRETIAYYQQNARQIRRGLSDLGLEVYGGVNAPYIWLRTPEDASSWGFFDTLLQQAQVVGTPGSGFGPCGEGYFRLTAFGSHARTAEAMDRIRRLFGG